MVDEYSPGPFITGLELVDPTTGQSCPFGYSKAPTVYGLNGDLNQGAGGKDIYLCVSKNPELGKPITGLKLQESGTCGTGWELVSPMQGSGLNGDLNQGSGGKDIFLCSSKDSTEEDPLTDILVTSKKPDVSRMPKLFGLNGDLNQDAGGKWISLEVIREGGDTMLPDEEALSVTTAYTFEPNKEPDYLTLNVLGTSKGPCWHAQQVATFTDSNYLYTFFTMSQASHGKAYLLRTELTETSKTTSPSVEVEGDVQWYEKTTDFNHPGDLVVQDRIILTAGQNWDPLDFWPSVFCEGLGACNCIADLPSNKEALIIWDFRKSLTNPARHEILKSAFNNILSEGNKMDASDADDLWGGDVDGNLIIQFEGKWLHWKGESLASEDGWEEIPFVHFPTCAGQVGGDAGRAFATIRETSYLASFEVGNPCYSLRKVKYDAVQDKLEVLCKGMIKQCTQDSQLLTDGEFWATSPKAFQTITEGTDGKVYMTSMHLHGTKTRVLASNPVVPIIDPNSTKTVSPTAEVTGIAQLSASSDDDGISSGGIAGVVIAVAVVLLFLILFAVVRMKRQEEHAGGDKVASIHDKDPEEQAVEEQPPADGKFDTA